MDKADKAVRVTSTEGEAGETIQRNKHLECVIAERSEASWQNCSKIGY